MEWFRVQSDITRNRKLRRIPAEHRWLFIACLCIARTSPVPGHLLISAGIPATDEDIADESAIDVQSVRDGMARLIALNMVHRLECGTYVITNFLEYQYKHPSDVPEATRERQRRHRDKQKDASRECHENVTRQIQSTDTDTEEEYLRTLAAADANGDRVKSDTDRIEEIYQAYPRKEGKTKALKAISKASDELRRGKLKPDDPPDVWPPPDPYAFLFERVVAFAAYARGLPADKQRYIPHPSTWFNEGRYLNIPKTVGATDASDRTNRLETKPARESSSERRERKLQDYLSRYADPSSTTH